VFEVKEVDAVLVSELQDGTSKDAAGSGTRQRQRWSQAQMAPVTGQDALGAFMQGDLGKTLGHTGTKCGLAGAQERTRWH
jgi:hypothetical protein